MFGQNCFNIFYLHLFSVLLANRSGQVAKTNRVMLLECKDIQINPDVAQW